MKRTQDNFRGCLLGGAIGDALGYPVEFMDYAAITRQYGPDGIDDLELGESGKAEITDDTQMTLFTAEGILRGRTRSVHKGICYPPSVVFYAYQRWLVTQGYPQVDEWDWAYDGWLLDVEELHAKRAPGSTCLSALEGRVQGSIAEPINTRKGCGGVMRIAPAGLFWSRGLAFEMAAEFAAITHGHPSGYLSAGALGYLIAALIEGVDIGAAVDATIDELGSGKLAGFEECVDALRLAVELAGAGAGGAGAGGALSDPEAIAQLGEGWTGEEALAIAVYCALKYRDDFKQAVITAVNHSGDSDSTGAITGNILGAYLGVNVIPAQWMADVELADVLVQIADDLLAEYDDDTVGWERYPGY